MGLDDRIMDAFNNYALAKDAYIDYSKIYEKRPNLSNYLKCKNNYLCLLDFKNRYLSLFPECAKKNAEVELDSYRYKEAKNFEFNEKFEKILFKKAQNQEDIETL